jgi:tetratricopeptide (TPR) repeat protein
LNELLTLELRSADALHNFATGLREYAAFEAGAGDGDTASAAYRREIEIRKEVAGKTRDASDLREILLAYRRYGTGMLEANRFPEARDVYRQATDFAEATLKTSPTAVSPADVASTFGSLSWVELFNKDFDGAIRAASHALELDKSQTWIKTNLAHGYLFSNKTEDAQKVYLENKDAKLNDQQTFLQSVLDDFKEFRKRGLADAEMERKMQRIEALLNGKA